MGLILCMHTHRSNCANAFREDDVDNCVLRNYVTRARIIYVNESDLRLDSKNVGDRKGGDLS